MEWMDGRMDKQEGREINRWGVRWDEWVNE